MPPRYRPKAKTTGTCKALANIHGEAGNAARAPRKSAVMAGFAGRSRSASVDTMPLRSSCSCISSTSAGPGRRASMMVEASFGLSAFSTSESLRVLAHVEQDPNRDVGIAQAQHAQRVETAQVGGQQQHPAPHFPRRDQLLVSEDPHIEARELVGHEIDPVECYGRETQKVPVDVEPAYATLQDALEVGARGGAFGSAPDHEIQRREDGEEARQRPSEAEGEQAHQSGGDASAGFGTLLPGAGLPARLRHPHPTPACRARWSPCRVEC